MTTACRSAGSRKGLSTLEMVLALPLLLFIMALMVNYGAVAAWKVRALTVSREMVWSTRWPRSGTTNPRPEYWPVDDDPADHNTMSVGLGGPNDIDALDDPQLDYPVVRGPDLWGTRVRENLLNPGRGLREGSARMSRDFPLLPKLGPYNLESADQLLDDHWQYTRMGLWRNRLRRLPVIYELARAPQAYSSAYVQAAMAILNSPQRTALRPLDRDDEFYAYNALLGRGRWAPDFHPHLRRFCTLDPAAVERRVTDLIDADENGGCGSSISRVPRCMTDRFIALYEAVIRYYQSQPEVTPAMQAEIAQLQQKIDTLRQFQQTLN